MCMRWVVGAIGLLALCAFSLGRSMIGSVQAADTASLRIVNAATGAPPFDITIDGQPLVRQLAFSAVSPAQTVAASNHALAATVSGQPQNPVFNTSVAFTAGADTTVAIVGLWPTVTIIPLPNSTPTPDAGQAMVRLVNGAPWLQPMDLIRNGSTPMFSNVAYRTAADYVSVASGAYELEAREHGQTSDVVDDKGVSFANGEDVTLIVAGNGSDDNPVLMPVVTRASAAAANVSTVPATGAQDAAGRAPIVLVALALLAALAGLGCVRSSHTTADGD